MKEAPPPFLPRAAVRLSFLAILPLVVAALLCISPERDVARLGATAFAIYAACVLSFLGGVRFGLEIARAPGAPDPIRLAFTGAPVLAGWALAFFVIATPGALPASAAFAGLFAAQWVWDAKAARDAAAPAWYPLLRQVLTGGLMVACMLIPLATMLRRL